MKTGSDTHIIRGGVIEPRLYASENDLVQILAVFMTSRAQTSDWRLWSGRYASG